MEFQEFLKYSNGTILLTSFVPSFPSLLAIFTLNLNEALSLFSAGKPAIAPVASKNGSSL